MLSCHLLRCLTAYLKNVTRNCLKILGGETLEPETRIRKLRIILGWISRRWDVGIWTGLGWPRIEKGRGRL